MPVSQTPILQQSETPSRPTQDWFVSAAASDTGAGTRLAPFRTIQQAADVAGPGDRVLIAAGVYRERVCPARGGTPEAPITYLAPDSGVFIRGSEHVVDGWVATPTASVWRLPLRHLTLGSAAYQGRCDPAINATFNPYLQHFNRAKTARPHEVAISELRTRIDELGQKIEKLDPMEIAFADLNRRRAVFVSELEGRTRATGKRLLQTLGQVFVAGVPLTEAESVEEVFDLPGVWIVDEAGENILVHLTDASAEPSKAFIEITTRHAVFSPLVRGLGHITLQNLTIEHAANPFPTWGAAGWPQAGALSMRSGHHWTINRCTVRFAKGIGIDCGSEGGQNNTEFRGEAMSYEAHHTAGNDDTKGVGYHVIQHCVIEDNGLCGIAGIRHTGTQVLHNIIQRNNRDGWTSPWWEFGGIKFHFFYNGRIEGNLIRDNDAHGIWIDNQFRGSRITRNVIINNLWSGINVELGRGPVLIDNNIIAHTRQGDGIYGHDVADVTIAHNLLYANANYGAWFAYATPRVKPMDGCWDIRILNNLILGNRAGAVGLPLPWACAGNNFSNGNLFVGAGEYLDEGSESQPPQFAITNRTHCGQMQKVLGADIEAQTTEVVVAAMQAALRMNKLPERQWPAWDSFAQTSQVNHEIWSAASGNDSTSRTVKMIRDGLSLLTTCLTLPVRFPDDAVRCETVPSIDRDFLGQPYPATPRPGPFQQLEFPIARLPLWPVRR